MKKKVAIIPARGGSKRIPRKNIREFCGRPMIEWSIEAALKSDCFDRVIVSTDSEEVLRIAEAAGADVPFLRPPELSNDHAGTLPVIRHALEWLDDHGVSANYACCIYATAPFLQVDALKRGEALLMSDPEVDFVFSAVAFDFPIFRAIRLDEESRVSMFWPEHEKSRSQDFPEAFHDAGQFYWGRRESWLEKDVVFSSNARAVKLPPHLVQDIDTPEDWVQAELKYKALSE